MWWREGGQADVQRSRRVLGHSIPPVPPILSPDRSAQSFGTRPKPARNAAAAGRPVHPRASVPPSPDEPTPLTWARPLGSAAPHVRAHLQPWTPAGCASRRHPGFGSGASAFNTRVLGPARDFPVALFVRPPDALWSRPPSTRGGSQAAERSPMELGEAPTPSGTRFREMSCGAPRGQRPTDGHPQHSQSSSFDRPAAASLTSYALGPLCLH